MRNLQWFDGAPAEIAPGMVIHVGEPINRCFLVGHTDAGGQSCLGDPDKIGVMQDDAAEFIVAWAWHCKPHELEWLEDMAKRRVRK